jgi:hypothetical protein
MYRLGLTLAVVALSIPVYANPAIYVRGNEYYVAHKAQDRICVVFQTKPQGRWIIVGIYKSVKEAAAIMKTSADCTTAG